MTKRYTVSDGRMMLYLWPAEEGGYNVTSPLDPALITQAETLEEAFAMAYDAQKCLRAARAKLAKRRDSPATQENKTRAANGSDSISSPEKAEVIRTLTRKPRARGVKSD